MKRIEDVKIGDKFIVTPELNSFWAGEGVVSYKPTAGGKYLSLRMATGRQAGTVGGFLFTDLKEPASINPGFVIGAPLPTFKVGDKVKITRKAITRENGWGNSWVTDMDKEIGKIGTVSSIVDQGTGKDVSVRTNTGNWGYPTFVLELQKERYIIEFNNGSKWQRSGNKSKDGANLFVEAFTSKSEAEAEAKYQQDKSVSDYPYRVVELTGTPVEVKPEPKRAFRVGDYVKVSGEKAYGWDGEGTVYSLYGTDGLQGTIGVEMKTGNFTGERGGFTIGKTVTLIEAPEVTPQELKYVDYLGQEIKVGSFIVYPGRQGSSLYVNLGIVKKLTESRNKPTLLVRSVSRYSTATWDKATLNSKNTTLTEFQRAVVVPRGSVSISVRTKLEA